MFNEDDIYFSLSSGATLHKNICLHILENDMNLPMQKIDYALANLSYSSDVRTDERDERLDKFGLHYSGLLHEEQDQVMQRINLNNVEYMKSPIEYSWKVPDMYIIYGSYEVLIAELPEAKKKS